MTKEIYFEELFVGQRFRAGPIAATLDDLVRFARELDPQYFHVDPDAARESMFGGLISSGWRTAALSMRLLIEEARFAGGVVGAGGEVEWLAPVRPGDSLSIESEVLELVALRSWQDRGLATIRTTTFNQEGRDVQILRTKLVVFRGPAPD